MIGRKLADRYEIVGELGRGGMGVVYRARDPVLGRDVAVKLVPSSVDADTCERLRREAKVVAAMDHPAIVSVHDMGEDDGSLFFVMPVVTGDNLRVLIRDARLTAAAIYDIGSQVARGLEYSHARGVFHRDVKPENIMVSREADGRYRARIMDFGLAWTGFETRLTQSGALIGTIAYLSPEQVSERDIDERSDIYSLGCVLYECLTGSPPFSGETHATLYRIVYEKPRGLRDLGVEVPPEVDEYVLRCLAKSPRDRPQRVSEVAALLEHFRTQAEVGSESGAPARPRIPARRGPRATPFVGREVEIAELETRVQAMLEGECQLVILAGDVGMGKSRLIQEFEALLRARDIRVLHGRFTEQEQHLPFNGFCEVIQDFFRIKDDTDTSTGLPDFSDLALELTAQFPMLAEIAPLRDAAAATTGVDPAEPAPEARTYLFELLSRTLARLSSGRPLVIVLEELHQADVSIEALIYVVRRLAPTPTLIIGSYRSLEADRRHPVNRLLEHFRSRPNFSLLPLAPFTVAEVATFVGRLGGDVDVDEALAKQLHEATEGNPLFVEELVRALMQEKVIVKDDSGGQRLTSRGLISTSELPASLRQAVENRIDRLPEEMADVLAMASVIGRTFEFRDLEYLSGGRGDLDDVVDRLIDEGLLVEKRDARGDALAFASAIVCEAVYATLTRRKRRTYHRRIADHLERRSPTRPEPISRQLLFHFSRADQAEKVVEYGLMVIRQSLDAYSPQEALDAIGTVLEFIDDERIEDRLVEGEILQLAVRAHRMEGNVDAALKAAKRAVGVFEGQDRADRVRQVVALAARIAWEGRRIEQASRWVERGIEGASGPGDAADLCDILTLASTLGNLRGEYRRAAELRERARELEEQTPAPEELLLDGGRLVVGMASSVTTHDPALALTAEENEILANVFETLLTTDEQGELKPQLCESWEILDGGRALLLTLRRRVSFHDGTPMSAVAVKASLERSIRRSYGRTRAAFSAIRGAELAHDAGTPRRRRGPRPRRQSIPGIVVIGREQLRIELTEAFPIFPMHLAAPAMAISLAAGDDDTRSLPAGTGPFRFQSVQGDRIVLERNVDYWGGRAPRLATLEFRVGLEGAALQRALEAGEIDLARQLAPDALEQLASDAGAAFRVLDSPRKTIFFLLFNTRGGPLGVSSVRLALTRILDVDGLVRRWLGRFAEPATGMIPPGILGHDPASRQRLPLAIEHAKFLLENAELKPPIRLRAAVHPAFQDRYRPFYDALTEAWSRVGVEIVNETRSMRSFFAAVNEEGADVDLVLARWVSDYDDPDNFTRCLFHSEYGALKQFCSSPELDELGEKARMTQMPDEREALYREMVRTLLDLYLVVPLFHENDLCVVSRAVKGTRLRSMPPYVGYAELRKVPVSEGSAASQPREILHIPCGGRIKSLDPARAWTSTAFEVLPNVFETLTRVSDVAQVRPWLAAEVRDEDDGRRFRFRLRPDVRFHDGRRLTARDVRYTFERMLRGAKNRIDVLSCVAGAEELRAGRASELSGFRVESARDFSVDLAERVAIFPMLLTSPTMAIAPEGARPLGEGLSGTGPFRVVDFDPGLRLELEANPDYWREGLPRSAGLVFQMSLTADEIVDGFRDGRLALATDITRAHIDMLRHGSGSGAGYRESPGMSTAFAAFNSQKGPLADDDLRRRIVAAIDVDDLVRTTVTRLAVPARGLIPPELAGFRAARSGSGVRAESSSRAISNVQLTAAVPPSSDGLYRRVADRLFGAFADRGVIVEIVTASLNEYFRVLDEGAVDIVLGRWNATYPDPDSFAHGLFHSQTGVLREFAASPEIDRLIARGRADTTADRRHATYHEFELHLARNALLLPLFHTQLYRFARPDLRGLKLTLTKPAVAYEELGA